MRRLLFVMFFAALIFTTLFEFADAFTIYKSFGGRITTTSKPSVTCVSGKGPISIMPAQGSEGGEYLAIYLHNKSSGKQPKMGGQILGLASFKQQNCTQGQKPYEKPYSTKPTAIQFGVSN